METLFYHIYVWVQRHRVFSAVVAFLFLGVCGLLASKIRFEEDITQIIPKNEQADEFSRALKQINFADKITVLIEKGDTVSSDILAEMADVLIDSIAKDSLYIREITGRVGQDEMEDTYNFVYQHLPLFLEEEDYS